MRYLLLFVICLYSYSVRANYLNIDSTKLMKDNPSFLFNKKNNIQLEIFGNGTPYSFKYERLLINSRRLKTVADIGNGLYLTKGYVYSAYIAMNQLYSLSIKNHVEIGGSYKYVIGHLFGKDFDEFHTTLRIGYRRQNPSSKWLFRVAILPWTKISPHHTGWEPGLGFSLGYKF